MFFFLSKVLSFLVMPFTIICILFITAFFVRRTELRRKLFISGFVLLLFFSNDFLANEVMLLWEVPVTPLKDLKKNYELGVILTGVTKHDVGPDDRVYFNCGAD